MATTFAPSSHFTETSSTTFRSPHHEFEYLDGSYSEFEGHVTFRTYPSSAGFKFRDLKQGIYPNSVSPSDLAQFLQQWLFFGLSFSIAQIAGPPLGFEELLFEGSDGKTYLTISRIPFLLRFWICNEGLTYTAQKANERRSQVESYLRETGEVLNAFHKLTEGQPEDGGEDWREVERVCLAVSLLHEELIKLLQRVYVGFRYTGESWVFGGDGKLRQESYPAAQIRGTRRAISPLLERLLVDSNWCPCDIQLLLSQGGEFLINRVYQLSKFKRPKKDHDKCEGLSCRATTGKRTHVEANCKCEPIGLGAGAGDVVTIIKNGGSATILADNEDIEDPSILVQATEKSHAPTKVLAQAGKSFIHAFRSLKTNNPNRHSMPSSAAMKPYVAISHVWLDGLGDPIGNTILACQLQRIQDLVDDLYPKSKYQTPFWIDTISIPSGKGPRVAEMKNLALQKMANTYIEADKVLVLEGDLCSISTDRDPEELLARIQYSRWNRRLWCFQEGAFPKNLYFQFEDIAVKVEDLMAKYKKNHFSMLSSFFGGYPNMEEITYLKKKFAFSYRLMDQFWVYCVANKGIGFIEINDWDDDPVMKGIRIVNQMGKYSISPTFTSVCEYWDSLRSSTKSLSKSEHFAAVVAQFAWRTVTKAEDEPKCLAILLGIDTKVVTDLEAPRNLRWILDSKTGVLEAEEISPLDPDVLFNHKMAAVLQCYPSVPKSIIFSRGPRLPVEGFRWAPKTFLEMRADGELDSPDDIGYIMSNPPCIWCSFPGLVLGLRDKDGLEERDTVWFDVDGQVIEVTLDSLEDEYHPERAPNQKGKRREVERIWGDVVGADYKYGDLALVLRTEWRSTSTSGRAILVKKIRKHTKSGSVWVEYICPAIITVPEDEEEEDLEDFLFVCDKVEEGSYWYIS